MDSIYIGDIEINRGGFVNLSITSPNVFDTSTVLSFRFTSSDAYVTQNQYIVKTEAQTTGNNEIEVGKAMVFTISPNPTTAKITLKLKTDPSPDPLSITVNTLTGQTIWQQNFKIAKPLTTMSLT